MVSSLLVHSLQHEQGHAASWVRATAAADVDLIVEHVDRARALSRDGNSRR